MELTPDYIGKHKNLINTQEAVQILKKWVLNSNDPNQRYKALELLREFDSGEDFQFYEQILLTDEDSLIASSTGKILIKKYSKNAHIIELAEYLLHSDVPLTQRFVAIDILRNINNNPTFSIIKSYIREFLEDNFPNKVQKRINKVYLTKNQSTLSSSLTELCTNFVLYKYYTQKCSFNITLRDGLIILLNAEGKRLESIPEIPALEKLGRLEHLILRRNEIKYIQGLSHLQNLKHLDLSRNRIKSINNLYSLSNLEELYISSNEIEEITGLENLCNLRKLSLNENRIEKIENLENLAQLEELNLDSNNISQIKGLNHLVELKKLTISNNKILKIRGLNQLKQLQRLYLKSNKISKIENLDNLSNLKGLYLSGNRIDVIENLGNLLNLGKLELSNNKIKQISGLDHLQKLQELYLDNNFIDDIEQLCELKSLIILFLKNNRIEHFDPAHLRKLPNLNFIFLNENPLDTDSQRSYNRRTRYP